MFDSICGTFVIIDTFCFMFPQIWHHLKRVDTVLLDASGAINAVHISEAGKTSGWGSVKQGQWYNKQMVSFPANYGSTSCIKLLLNRKSDIKLKRARRIRRSGGYCAQLMLQTVNPD